MKIDLRITTGVAAALLASACSQNDNGWTATDNTAVCMDKAGNRVSDDHCQRRESFGSGGAARSSGIISGATA